MSSKIICENEIENVTFKLSSNDDKNFDQVFLVFKQYQQLCSLVEHDEMNDIIPIAPCDYFTAVNAVMFSETLEEVKERFSRTWAEDNVNDYIDYITK